MLIMSTSQIRAFTEAAISEFDHRILHHLKQSFPGDQRPTEAFVREARLAAEGNGLHLELEVCLFLYIKMIADVNPAANPANPDFAWIQALLSQQHNLPAHESRIESLFYNLHEKGVPIGHQ